MDNFLLENQTYFQRDTVRLINQFLQSQEKPICFVAHNGNRFDYPILKTEIHRTGESLIDDVLCIDSLEAFRDLHNRQTDELVQENKATINSIAVPPEFQDGYDELLCQIADEMEGKTEKKSVEEIKRINETTPKKRILFREDIFASTSTESVESTARKITSSANKSVVKKLNFG